MLQLSLTEEQQMLRQSIDTFMRNETPPHRIVEIFRHGGEHKEELYLRAARLGWLGLFVPEAYGGGGGTLGDCAVAFEEFGKGPFPSALFSMGVLAPTVVVEGGSEEQKRHWLPEMVGGTRRVAIADVDGSGGWSADLVDSHLVAAGEDLRLSGLKRFVHDADMADTLLCAARNEVDGLGGITLVLVDKSSSGVDVRPCQGTVLDVSEVEFNAVQVGRERVVGPPSGGWEILERSVEKTLPVLCSFMVGACGAIFEFTLQYTRDRYAFGQAIGRFQRVQDHVVELANHMDAARWVTQELLWQLESGVAVSAGVHEAKAVASDAYYESCNYSHMVHAGPGTDLDHPLMVHTLLSRTLFQYLGDPNFHRRRMMDLLFPI